MPLFQISEKKLRKSGKRGLGRVNMFSKRRKAKGKKRGFLY